MHHTATNKGVSAIQGRGEAPTVARRRDDARTEIAQTYITGFMRTAVLRAAATRCPGLAGLEIEAEAWDRDALLTQERVEEILQACGALPALRAAVEWLLEVYGLHDGAKDPSD